MLLKDNVYGFVYKITNTINGKAYVGQHIGLDFGEYCGSGVMLHRAYKKYGMDVFTRDILEYASTKEELNFLERFYIQHENTLIPNGYNIATGGRGGYTGELTNESREKIRNRFKGKSKSEEHKKKMSESKKGVPTHKQTDETRRKISQSHMGIEPWNKGKGKRIAQFTMDGKLVRCWNSMTEASQHGFNASCISMCIHEKTKHHRNFVWRFE